MYIDLVIYLLRIMHCVHKDIIFILIGIVWKLKQHIIYIKSVSLIRLLNLTLSFEHLNILYYINNFIFLTNPENTILTNILLQKH